MKKIFKLLFLFLILFCLNDVYAIPANDTFLDDNLYKCIIDAYNKENNENKNYSYNITVEELDTISSLDCSKYKGKIEDLTGLNNLLNLTSLNLSGNTFLGGSLKITNKTGKLKSNIKLPNNLTITNKTYKIDDPSIVKISNDVVTSLKKGSTYVTMTGKVSGNNISERYLVTVSPSNLSTNTRLSSLYLSKGEFRFDSNQRNYSTIVDNAVDSVVITATLSDKKSKFVTGYGPRTVKLNVGTNILEVKVQAEDDSVGTYIISVIRSDGEDNNNKLANIELSVGKIDFDSEMYTYNFSVASNVDEIYVKGVAESPLSKVTVTDISGNTKDDKISSKLKVGTNKIIITVNSESNTPQNYELIINREDYDSEDNYLESLNIKNYSINFKRDTYNYNLNIKNEKTLVIIPKLEKSNSTFNIIGNDNLVNGSKVIIKVSDSEGSTREYTINIHKEETSNIDFRFIVLLIEFLIIIILIFILLFRKKDRPKKPKKIKIKKMKPMGNSSSSTCPTCGTFNDIKSKTCYVCGNRLK